MYRIAFIDGPLKGRKLTVQEELLCIGSDPDCSLRFTDPAVAGRHAEVEDRGGVVHVRRAAAGAALLVNGSPVADGPVALKSGDIIGIAAHRLRVERAGIEPPVFTAHRASGLSGAAVMAIVIVMAVQALLFHLAFKNGGEIRAAAAEAEIFEAATNAAAALAASTTGGAPASTGSAPPAAGAPLIPGLTLDPAGTATSGAPAQPIRF